MMFVNFWDYVLSPPFLITFGISVLFFAPLAYSVWVTWRDNEPTEE